MEDTEAPASLLDLPDPCLLAVLQRLVDLFSAARAHSRLNRAAVVALSRITVNVRTQQQLDDSLLPYLGKHGQHVGSMLLQGRDPSFVGTFGDKPAKTLQLQHLPASLQLTSLQVKMFDVQLQPGNGSQGVLSPGMPLKQLRLGGCCTLLDEQHGLAAALHGLPCLEHFSVSLSSHTVATDVLSELQHLTYLDLHYESDDTYSCVGTCLQPLQALSHLVDLQVTGPKHTLTSSILSGLCSLTRLALTCTSIDPAALAGKNQLQRLELARNPGDTSIAGGSAGIGQLLAQLQHLTPLTHLDLERCLCYLVAEDPPATAFAALTASSKLQHLDISDCLLPEGAWQHVFPAGRQLPHMRSLVLAWVSSSVCKLHPNRGVADGQWEPVIGPAAFDSSVVSCCPGLQHLDLALTQCSKGLLDALLELSKLTLLKLGVVDGVSGRDVLESVCQLTGLINLQLDSPAADPADLLLLAPMQQLTHFCRRSEVRHSFFNPETMISRCFWSTMEEPVWRQVLKELMKKPHFKSTVDPAVAQQAAAALAE